MSDEDKMMIELAAETNPIAIATAERHLEKGLMILSKEIGLAATGVIVAGILDRLESELPSRRPTLSTARWRLGACRLSAEPQGRRRGGCR